MTKEMLTEYEMIGLSITEQFEELSIAIKYVDKLHGAIRRKMYAEGFEEGRKAGREEAYEKSIEGRAKRRKKVFAKSRQERRDEIVEQAKGEIDALNVLADEYYYTFEVNREKRTVVTLKRRVASGMVWGRGIAKCGPSDCFNVHIGKAIALRRALGLEVPIEYINTPQPTEVREGDIIRWKWGGRSYRVDKCREDGRYNFTNMRSGERFYGMDYTNIETVVDVIDDSREEE